MIFKLKELLSSNRGIVENFSYLSLAQLFNMLFPLITYPYLLRVLGKELYGEVIYAQAIAVYFVIFIAFGFNVSGAKEVAIHKNNKQRLSEIFSTIMGIKTFFFLFSFFIFFLVLIVLDLKKGFFWLYIFSFFICLNELLFPQWFFQGIEKIKYITIVNLLIKSVFLIFIFFLINSKSDYLRVPLLNALGAFIGGLVVLYILFVKEGINFYIPKKKTMFVYIKKNMPLFLSDLVISVKDRLNIIFIGHFLGKGEVPVYDLGIRLTSALLSLVGVINNAIFPKMAIEKSKLLLKKLIKYSFIVVSFLALITIALTPFILKIIGGSDLETGVLPIRLLLLSSVIMSFSLPLSRNCLIVFDKYRLLLLGMLFTSLFYLLCIALVYRLNLLNSLLSFVVITILVYLFELFYRIIVCRKEKII